MRRGILIAALVVLALFAALPVVVILGRALGPDYEAIAQRIRKKYPAQLERLRTEIRSGGFPQTEEQIHADWDLLDEPGVLEGTVQAGDGYLRTLWSADEFDTFAGTGRCLFSARPMSPGSWKVNLWTYETDDGKPATAAEYCELLLGPSGEERYFKLFVVYPF